jgi:hypothetical protein
VHHVVVVVLARADGRYHHVAVGATVDVARVRRAGRFLVAVQVQKLLAHAVRVARVGDHGPTHHEQVRAALVGALDQRVRRADLHGDVGGHDVRHEVRDHDVARLDERHRLHAVAAARASVREEDRVREAACRMAKRLRSGALRPREEMVAAAVSLPPRRAHDAVGERREVCVLAVWFLQSASVQLLRCMLLKHSWKARSVNCGTKNRSASSGLSVRAGDVSSSW